MGKVAAAANLAAGAGGAGNDLIPPPPQPYKGAPPRKMFQQSGTGDQVLDVSDMVQRSFMYRRY